MAHGPPPKLNDWCRSVSLSVHCDKRKEKDRLFVGAGFRRFALNPWALSRSSAGDRNPSHWSDVRRTTALPPKADVHPQSRYVAELPAAEMAGLRGVDAT